jgi:hypothetical protein
VRVHPALAWGFQPLGAVLEEQPLDARSDAPLHRHERGGEEGEEQQLPLAQARVEPTPKATPRSRRATLEIRP